MQRNLLFAVVTTVALVTSGACSSEPVAPRSAMLPAATRDVAASARFGNAAASVNAAFVADGFECGLGPAGSTTDSHLAATSAGTVSLTCRTVATPGPTPPLIVKGALCGIGPFTTTDMIFIWSPSGQASLVCQFRI